MSSRKAAWFSATSAMYDTFARNKDRYKKTIKQKITDLLQFHPAFMYGTMEIQVLPNRNEVRYTCKKTGNIVTERVRCDDITNFKGASYMLGRAAIRPEFKDIVEKLNTFGNNACFSFYYENIDLKTDKNFVLSRYSIPSGVLFKEGHPSLCIDMDLIKYLDVVGGTFKLLKHIDGIKLKRNIKYFEIQLFDDKTIKLPVVEIMDKDGSRTGNVRSINCCESMFYLLNSDEPVGLLRTGNEIMMQINEKYQEELKSASK